MFWLREIEAMPYKKADAGASAFLYGVSAFILLSILQSGSVIAESIFTGAGFFPVIYIREKYDPYAYA